MLLPLACRSVTEDYWHLEGIAETGPARRLRGLRIHTTDLPMCRRPWPPYDGDRPVGRVSSVANSPRFEGRVAIAMVDASHWDAETEIVVEAPDGRHPDSVCELPFGDPSTRSKSAEREPATS